jgi:AcrR family transcriptional regulator
MTSRPTSWTRETSATSLPATAEAGEFPDGDPSSVERRAPFSDNPRVGARGQRAQQRILDAALKVFGEDGYHNTGVLRITEVAGCSRPAFYQYFSSREDVFRHLAGQVARQLTASAEALGPITPDEAGWDTLHAWTERYAAIYDRYEAVFRTFQAAAETDASIAEGAARIGERNVATLRAKLMTTDLPARRTDAVIALLLECVSRTYRVVDVLQTAAPSSYTRTQVTTILTDVVHRTLFALDHAVNVHPPADRRPPEIPLGTVVSQALAASDGPPAPTTRSSKTRSSLLAAGHGVLVTRGYHGTRVDDITSAAGVSHGAFYRYFANKDQLVHLLAARAMQAVSTALAGAPDSAADPAPASSAELRRWLRRYATTHASETAMIRVWVDAVADDPGLGLESAATLDWGRRRMARFLEPRGFGDVDTEALAMLALLDAMARRGHSAPMVEAAALIIARGLLGLRSG